VSLGIPGAYFDQPSGSTTLDVGALTVASFSNHL